MKFTNAQLMIYRMNKKNMYHVEMYYKLELKFDNIYSHVKYTKLFNRINLIYLKLSSYFETIV